MNVTILIEAFCHGAKLMPFDEALSNGLPNFWRGTFFILLLTVALNFSMKRLPRVKKILQAALITLFTIFLVTDIFLLHKFGSVLHVNMIQIALGTNPLTVKQFFSDYVLTLPVIVGIVAVVAFIVLMSKGLKKFFVTRSEERLRRFTFDLKHLNR